MIMRRCRPRISITVAKDSEYHRMWRTSAIAMEVRKNTPCRTIALRVIHNRSRQQYITEMAHRPPTHTTLTVMAIFCFSLYLDHEDPLGQVTGTTIATIAVINRASSKGTRPMRQRI